MAASGTRMLQCLKTRRVGCFRCLSSSQTLKGVRITNTGIAHRLRVEGEDGTYRGACSTSCSVLAIVQAVRVVSVTLTLLKPCIFSSACLLTHSPHLRVQGEDGTDRGARKISHAVFAVLQAV